MSAAFGQGPLTLVHRPLPVKGSVDLDGVVASAREAAEGPVLMLSRCKPTAAFSRRDTLLKGYEEAASLARAAGFEPVVRPVGGRLAAYDAGSLVVHLWGPHSEPRRDLGERFVTMATCFAAALRDVGVPDVRVGAVPGEYCSGQWSVNTSGQAKLVGTGQRVFRTAFLFSAVVTVGRAEGITDVLARMYPALGLPLDPRSIGCVDDWVPGIDLDVVAEQVTSRLVLAVCGSGGMSAGNVAL